MMIMVLYFLLNILHQIPSPLHWSLMADVDDYGEWKTGKRITGISFSGNLFFLKLGLAIAGAMVGFLLSWYGYDAGAKAQSDSAINGIMLLFTSYVTGFSGGPLQLISSYIFVPMQRGLDYVGSSISISNEDAQTREELLAENEKLRQQVEDLSVQLNNTRLQQEELETLQELYQLDQSYMNYETTGARVIGRGASNWFDTFTIDKGSDDGIREDMNVIAGGGLVGIVTDVQATYSVVRTVINDTTNISGMTNTSWDHCIVSGSLSSMTESNTVRFSDLEDTQNAVSVGGCHRYLQYQ